MPEHSGHVRLKCLVWDLDNTLWDGVLLEEPTVTLRPGVVKLITTLDRRGILHSIASRNHRESALGKLTEFGLLDYFLYPQINWSHKSASVSEIASCLNLGLDAIGFIDDDPAEREEVQCRLPTVRCFDARAIETLADLPELTPSVISSGSGRRRLSYLAAMRRDEAEREYTGPLEEFLASLGLYMRIFRARDEDLMRAEELTLRTNQLNTTGYTYSRDDLLKLFASPDHLILMATLSDKFGDYGRIGLALISCAGATWNIKLLLTSCRVANRGAGGILINYIVRLARQNQVRLFAEFRETGRNQQMRYVYQFGGFTEVLASSDGIMFESDLRLPSFPSYVRIDADHSLFERATPEDCGKG